MSTNFPGDCNGSFRMNRTWFSTIVASKTWTPATRSTSFKNWFVFLLFFTDSSGIIIWIFQIPNGEMKKKRAIVNKNTSIWEFSLLSITKLEANGAPSDNLDFRGVNSSTTWETFYKVYCSWHTSISYTNPPADRHCVTIEKI